MSVSCFLRSVREEDTVSIMRGLSPAVVLKVWSSTQQAEDVLVSKYNSQVLQITRRYEP